MARVRIWDLPTRATHWLLVFFIAGAWAAAELDEIALHRLFGYGALILVLFRIAWGFTGSSTARFTTFVRGPKAFWSYAIRIFDRPGEAAPGHNPMGGWSVVGLLAVLLLQIGLGLFAMDDHSVEPGPLARFISFGAARRMASIHALVFNGLLALVALHIGAVLFYLVYKRENLVAAMFSGFKSLSRSETPILHFVPHRRALWTLAAAALAVAVIANL